jgi:hypothetical protein
MWFWGFLNQCEHGDTWYRSMGNILGLIVYVQKDDMWNFIMKFGSLSLFYDYDDERKEPPDLERIKHLAKPKVIKRNGSFYQAQ